MIREISTVELVEGGNIIRQGEFFRLGYLPRDAEGLPVDLNNKDITVAIMKRGQIVYEKDVEFDPGDGLIHLVVNENIGNGRMWLEFTVTDPNFPTYRRKFPSRQETALLDIVPGAEDLDFVGVSGMTVEKLQAEQASRQQAFEAEIVPQVDEMQQRLEDGIGAFTEDTEVLDARGGEVNLGTRLNKVTTKLAEKANQVQLDVKEAFEGRVKFGRVKLPAWFDPNGITLTRMADGNVYSDFNHKKYRDISFDRIYYVDTNNGLYQTTGDVGNPFKTLREALEKVAAHSGRNFNIIIKGRLFRDELGADRDVPFLLQNKHIVITPDQDELMVTNAQSSERDGGKTFGVNPKLVWTKTGNTYKTTRSNTANVVDLANRDIYGIGKPLQLVASIAAVESTPNSFFISGSDVYVRTINDRVPNDDLLVLLRSDSFAFKLVNTTFYIENTSFYSGTDAINRIDGAAYFEGDINSKLIMVNVKFSGGNIHAFSTFDNIFTNGLSVKNIKETYLINARHSYTRRDGLNYHYAGIPAERRKECFVYEENCAGHLAGIGDESHNNNATSAHEGIRILRVNGIGHDTKGRVAADANGCYSVLVDCYMENSTTPAANTFNASFSFNGDGAPNAVRGKAHLINCSGESFYSLTSDNLVDLSVERFLDYEKINPNVPVQTL